MKFRVIVSGSGLPTSPALPRGTGQLIVANHDPSTHAVCDLAELVTTAWLSEDVAASYTWLTEHFLEPFSCFMVGARAAVIVHAAAAALNGRAVLLCGDSGSGKTSVAWGCARRGWTFLSGDATQLLRDTPDLTIAGRPFTVRFREVSRALFPELQHLPAALGPRGKLDIEADPVTLGAAVAQTAIASQIVMLHRRDVPGALLEPLSPDVMFAYFDRAIFYGTETFRDQMRARVRQFLELPLYRLSYSNPDEAEQALRSLFEEAPC